MEHCLDEPSLSQFIRELLGSEEWPAFQTADGTIASCWQDKYANTVNCSEETLLFKKFLNEPQPPVSSTSMTMSGLVLPTMGNDDEMEFLFDDNATTPDLSPSTTVATTPDPVPTTDLDPLQIMERMEELKRRSRAPKAPKNNGPKCPIPRCNRQFRWKRKERLTKKNFMLTSHRSVRNPSEGTLWRAPICMQGCIGQWPNLWQGIHTARQPRLSHTHTWTGSQL